jgi:hypothetical protein
VGQKVTPTLFGHKKVRRTSPDKEKRRGVPDNKLEMRPNNKAESRRWKTYNQETPFFKYSSSMINMHMYLKYVQTDAII